MMRGTFANIRIKNHMVPGVEGGVTKHYPDGTQQAIYDAAMKYVAEGTPLVIFAGKEYGTGSSRDWAAKGTRLLGVRAVVAESFERIHRSNLIGMGVLPLQFSEGVSWKSLTLTGAETVTINGVAGLLPRQVVSVEVAYPDGTKRSFDAKVRIDTENELDYYRNGGILHYVLRQLAKAA
jgi:aconitate hydratase